MSKETPMTREMQTRLNILYRGAIFLMTTFTVIALTWIAGYGKQAIGQLTELTTQTALIKAEIASVRDGSVSLKMELDRAILSVEDRIRANGVKDEQVREMVNDVKTKIALIEERLQKAP